LTWSEGEILLGLSRRKPSKISPLECSVKFFLRYRLSGNSHPGSAKNPGPDLALSEMCFWLRFSHNTETFDAHVIERQGGLDITLPWWVIVKISRYEDGQSLLPLN